MKAIETITGRVSVLNRDDVDTDQIIPKQFLKRVERTGFGEFLFYDWAQGAGLGAAAQPDPRRRAQLRLRLEPRARAVGARGLRLPGDHRAELRRHLPLELHEDRAAAGRADRRGSARAIARGGRGAGRPRRRRRCAGRAGRRGSRSTREIKHRLLNGLDDIALTLAAGRTRSPPTSATASVRARSRRRCDRCRRVAVPSRLGRGHLRPRLRRPAESGRSSSSSGSQLSGDEVVLDAGCGSGRVTALLADRVPRGRVYAVDVRAVDGPSTPRRALGDRATVFCQDLVELELPEPVDAIFSNATFHWIARSRRAVRRAASGAEARAGGSSRSAAGAGNIDRVPGMLADAVARSQRFAPYFAGLAAARGTTPADGDRGAAGARRLRRRALLARAEVGHAGRSARVRAARCAWCATSTRCPRSCASRSSTRVLERSPGSVRARLRAAQHDRAQAIGSSRRWLARRSSPCPATGSAPRSRRRRSRSSTRSASSSSSSSTCSAAPRSTPTARR